MNKKTKIALVSLIASGLILVGLTATINYDPLIADVSAPQELNCSYYFNSNNGFTSIRELNDTILENVNNFPTDYKTWGTITCKYVSSNKTCYYIQSTDRIGRQSAILLYNASTTNLDVGNVVTVRGGNASVYNGSPQIVSATLTKDYDTNPSPVELYQATSDDFFPSSVNEKTAIGPLFTECKNVTIASVTNNSATLRFSDNRTITAFYGSSTAQSAVKSKFNDLNGMTTNVKGHIANYNGTFQLYVRDPAYVGNNETFLSYITVERKDNSPVGIGTTFTIDDFIVTAHYSDNTSAIVYNAIIDNCNTDYAGSGTVMISYTEGNKTVYDGVNIEVVEDDVDELEVVYTWEPRIYYIGEAFNRSDVLARHTSMYNTQIVDVAIDSSEFDSSTIGHYNITLSYTTRLGKVLTAEYEYYVAPLLNLEIVGNNTEYNVNSTFFPGWAYAVYDVSNINDLNDGSGVYRLEIASTKVTHTGYDMTTPGEQTVTVTYGIYSISYQITVISPSKYIEPRGTVKTSYVQHESYVRPTMYFVDEDLGTEKDVTDDCDYGYFDSYWTGEQNLTITYRDEDYNYYSYSYTVVVNEYVEVPQIMYIEVNSFKGTYKLNESFVEPTVTARWTNGDETTLDNNDVTFSGFDSTTKGRKTITVDYEGHTTTFNIMVTSNVDGLYMFDLSSINFNCGNYNTGNYGENNGLGYYRVRSNGNKTYALLPYTGDINLNALDGALYNQYSYDNIYSITLTYRTSGGSTKKPSITYGETNYDGVGKRDINYSTNSTTVEYNLNNQNVNYFKINSGDTTLIIEGLVVEYFNTCTPNGSSFVYNTSANDYRINPTIATGTLVDGVTSVTVPVDVSISGNSYTVNQTKTYTYYTYDYAQSHPEMANEIAMTDPMDVANYYTIFKEWPANYCLKSDYSSYSSTFGNLTRCVSEYDRTNGYATAVPYANNPSTGKPLYYEFDIALDSSYNSNSRGVGRVVGWKYGFNSAGYDNSPVCVYTDDHYSTFQEFNNMGGWNTRFDVERSLTITKWVQANTIN